MFLGGLRDLPCVGVDFIEWEVEVGWEKLILF